MSEGGAATHRGPSPWRHVEDEHFGPGLARDDEARGVVPGREAGLPVRIDVAGGDVAQVERRRPATAEVAYAAEELGHD